MATSRPAGVESQRQSAEAPGRLTAREAAKFGAAVALLGIFWDAAVGHGLAWENDPYWTYWVTKTFLIFTVFALGTAWVGVGVGRGAVLTGVHTLVLTVYYWTLSPIGLPSSPEWLDLEHTWATGLPIHFGVIYLGYLSTLWVWRRRSVVREAGASRDAMVALLAGIAIVVVAGGVAALAVWEWPGVQYFVVRLLITVPFIMLWFALAGRDAVAATAGAITLAFIWATYGEFVGPLGLPDTPLRITEQAPPPATAFWLDYRDTWLIQLPIELIVMTVVLLAAAAFLVDPRFRRVQGTAPPARGIGAVVVLAGFLLLANAWVDGGGTRARLDATGAAQVERGAWYGNDLVPARATLEVAAVDNVRRVSPLRPHDEVSVEATVEHPGGRTFEIAATQPIVSDPAGRHTTWWGVGVDVWHHGKSGIGTNKIPPVHAEVALFGLGTIVADGRSVAANVPIHVMTGSGDEFGGRLELDVGDPSALIPGIPDGHLRVVWSEYTGGADDVHAGRYAVGGVVLGLLLALALWAAEAAASGRRSVT